MLLIRQFSSIGHFSFFLQFHFGLWLCGFNVTFLLCPLKALAYCTCNCKWLQQYCGWKSLESWVTSWKTFCYQLKECLCEVCWKRFAKGWVKSYYVSILCFSFFWFIVGVFEISIVTRLLQRIFVFDFHCIKNILARRTFWQSLGDIGYFLMIRIDITYMDYKCHFVGLV